MLLFCEARQRLGLGWQPEVPRTAIDQAEAKYRLEFLGTFSLSCFFISSPPPHTQGESSRVSTRVNCCSSTSVPLTFRHSETGRVETPHTRGSVVGCWWVSCKAIPDSSPVHTPVTGQGKDSFIPALEILRQKDYPELKTSLGDFSDFQANLRYRVKSRLKKIYK